MVVQKSQEWFEFRDLRQRRYNTAVWVPLRKCDPTEKGQFGCEGYTNEFHGVTSLAVNLEHRDKATEIDWMTNGLHCTHQPYVDQDRYHLADVYEMGGIELGINTVLNQSFGGAEHPVWHLNQDMVLALGLLREGDDWVRPEEGYEKVVKLTRQLNGEPCEMAIKKQHLCDYLAARQMALKLNWFRCRVAVMENKENVEFENNHREERTADSQFRGHICEIHEGGMRFGGKSSVLSVTREDVDREEDVPVLETFHDANTSFSKATIEHAGRKLFEARGELWVEEWIEPSAKSPRVGGDPEDATCTFLVDASAARMSSKQILDSEENRWLWFRPGVVNGILSIRGTELEWSTKDTGTIRFVGSIGLRFGINPSDLLTIYARDICRLSEWQMRIFMGHNIAPEGGVNEEQIKMEGEGKFVETFAPEKLLQELVVRLNEQSIRHWGAPLIRNHCSVSELWTRLHRFRALETGGINALAKDISRLLIDQIDTKLLEEVAPRTSEDRRGSLKSLEAALATIVPADKAATLLSPLFLIYEIRKKDAHMPSSSDEAEKGIGIVGLSPLQAGHHLLDQSAKTLRTIGQALTGSESD